MILVYIAQIKQLSEGLEKTQIRKYKEFVCVCVWGVIYYLEC